MSAALVRRAMEGDWGPDIFPDTPPGRGDVGIDLEPTSPGRGATHFGAHEAADWSTLPPELMELIFDAVLQSVPPTWPELGVREGGPGSREILIRLPGRLLTSIMQSMCRNGPVRDQSLSCGPTCGRSHSALREEF